MPDRAKNMPGSPNYAGRRLSFIQDAPEPGSGIGKRTALTGDRPRYPGRVPETRVPARKLQARTDRMEGYPCVS